MAKLTTKTRNALRSSTFALPGRRYPIEDRSHARNALSRVSQNGTPGEKAEVRAAVHRRYPTLGRLDDGGSVPESGPYDLQEGEVVYPQRMAPIVRALAGEPGGPRTRLTPIPDYDPRNAPGYTPLSSSGPTMPAPRAGSGDPLPPRMAPPSISAPVTTTSPSGSLSMAPPRPLSRLEQDYQQGFQPPKMSTRDRILRTIAASAGGALAGWGGHPQEGMAIGQQVMGAPLRRAQDAWNQKIQQDTALDNLDRQQAQDELGARSTNSEIDYRDAQTEAERALADQRNNPAPKMRPVIVRDDGGNPAPALQNEGTGEVIGEDGKPIANAQMWEKPAAAATGAPQKPPETKTMMIGGKPHYMGWNPQTGKFDQEMGEAPPSFAETGLYEPITDANGQTVKFDRRTGATSPVGGAAGAPVLSGPQSSELKTVEETARDADKRLRTMEDNSAAAAKGDQQAMLSIIANHIGMTMGAQKGARINQAVWNEAVQSAPWLARVATKWDKDGYLTGVTLTPDQIRQMVDLGKTVRLQQWRQVHDTMAQFGATDYSHVIPSDVLPQVGGQGGGSNGASGGAPGFAAWKASQGK